jgi:hypothetical protein
MASLINLNINVENLPKEKFVKGKKGVYYNFTISVNDDTNQFGQNVSAFDSQTKEEREAKKPKQYIGNGKVVWTDGKSTKAQQEAQPQDNDNNVDLPF